MPSFKKFNLNDIQDATHKVSFIFPGIGDTGETITIRSQYSNEFREAEAKFNRQVASMTIAGKGAPLDEALLKEMNDRMFASLIAAWSFEEPVTEENIMEFIATNPQFKDELNRLAAQDSLFFKKEETN